MKVSRVKNKMVSRMECIQCRILKLASWCIFVSLSLKNFVFTRGATSSSSLIWLLFFQTWEEAFAVDAVHRAVWLLCLHLSNSKKKASLKRRGSSRRYWGKLLPRWLQNLVLPAWLHRNTTQRSNLSLKKQVRKKMPISQKYGLKIFLYIFNNQRFGKYSWLNLAMKNYKGNQDSW